MSKAKAKSGTGKGTGKGTDKKGWKRWTVSANKAKLKPYTSKGVKKADERETTSDNKGDKSEK